MAGGVSPIATSLDDLSPRFDVFLVDQFGVLHDGTAAYPGAVNALKALKSAGKRVALLSNSGKRSAPNRERLARLGFEPEDYDLFLSSGEVAWNLLAEEMIGDTVPAGAKCLLLARDDDGSAIEGLDLTRTRSGEDAQLVIISGSRGDKVDLAVYERFLANPASRNVPCLCTNPDKVMLTARGLRFGAGAIAELYAGFGGRVTWIGKPHGAIYSTALTALGNPDRGRVCCLGDSIEHDIAGGSAAGLATALVRTGIHAAAGEAELAALYNAHDVRPDYVIRSFF